MKQLDLRKDFADVYAFVSDRVRSFDPAGNDGPSDEDNQGYSVVSRIDIGFGLYQSGWVCLVFDTRVDPEPDGEWTMHIDRNDLERPHWVEACDAVEQEPLALIRPDGTREDLPVGKSVQLALILGNMLRDVLLKARADGVFVTLPKTDRCELGVEEQEGSYGWPEYESRGVENFVSL